MTDERNSELRKRFPLRLIRLDMCVCGHDDSDHETEIGITQVDNGACALCVCKRFELPSSTWLPDPKGEN